ncbi:MAG: EpsG family protein [Clostridia bacterium]|nr:EpsG family protein [Clostridia bacterium]
MSSFLLIIAWVCLVLMLSTVLNTEREEIVLGEKKRRVTPFIAFVVILPVILMAANRSLYLFDTGAYHDQFYATPNTFSEFVDFFPSIEKDHGFSVLMYLTKVLPGGDHGMFFLIVAMAQGLCIFYVYRKYSDHYLWCIFLFVASTDAAAWMHNGIRQFLAVTLIFLGTGLLLKKRYVLLILLILFASLFHQSALIMIPIIFVVQGKAWNKRTMLFILGILAAVFFVDQFTGLLDSALEETQYSNVVTDWQEFQDDGTNPIRVLVYSVPTIIAFFARKHIAAEENALLNVCVNMSIVSTGLYVLSMVTSGIMIGRLPIFTSLFNYILLPWELDLVLEKNSVRLGRLLMAGFYLMFYFYQMHFAWGLI